MPKSQGTTLPTDAGRRAAWEILWRKLLGEPPLLDDLADAIERAEPIPAPADQQNERRSAPYPRAGGAQAPENATKPACAKHIMPPGGAQDERRPTSALTRGGAQTPAAYTQPARTHDSTAVPSRQEERHPWGEGADAGGAREPGVLRPAPGLPHNPRHDEDGSGVLNGTP